MTKSYTVIARNERGKKRLRGKSHVQVYDSGEAAELEKEKRDLNVVEDERHEWHLKHDKETDGYNSGVHHYTFGPNRRYADAWESFERRRKMRTRKQAVEGD